MKALLNSRLVSPRRFSVRSLMLIVLLLSVSLAILARHIDSCRNQHNAVIALNEISPTGAHYFLGDVLMLEIVGDHGDESLKRLAVFPRLKNLYANCPAITNEGLEHIGRSRSLQMLSLRDTRIDDDGIRHLAGLDNLVVLWLNNTNVTKAGVEKLQEEIPDCDIRYRPGPGPW